MPGKVKVKIISGKNLPVMDRSSDTTDAYVEIKLGSTTYKTDVCRKTLHPHWNSEWYKFEVDDSELQDEPLQIRLMDHDTYSANDAIGKVYLNLNPLLLPAAGQLIKYTYNGDNNANHDSTGNSVMSGWIPVYDTMHGIRGEVNVIVKVELFSDFNRFRQSSCGVQFYCSPSIPHGFYAQVVHGFVEELVVNDDPEYQWIDKIRTPRASNEARQTLFFKLSGELQRKIGVKALNLGGNAVIGYSQRFDLEGESGIVARGIGTAVTLVKIVDIPHVPPEINEERALSYLKFIGYDKSFRLSAKPDKSSLLIPFPHQVSSHFDPSSSEFVVASSSTEGTHFLRCSQSNPTLAEHVHHPSLKTLLKQEDLRGKPGRGISQRIKNLKYSSQSALSKKMSILKAKLGDAGIGEELDEELVAPKRAIHHKRRIIFKRTVSDSSMMAELLARSVLHAHNSLSCILEVQNSPPKDENYSCQENETLEILEPIADFITKTVSIPNIPDDDVNIELQSENMSYSSSESSSSDFDDYDDDNFEENKSSNYDFETISNIITNVEMLETQTHRGKLRKQYSLPALTSKIESIDKFQNREFAWPVPSESEKNSRKSFQLSDTNIFQSQSNVNEDSILDKTLLKEENSDNNLEPGCAEVYDLETELDRSSSEFLENNAVYKEILGSTTELYDDNESKFDELIVFSAKSDIYENKYKPETTMLSDVDKTQSTSDAFVNNDVPNSSVEPLTLELDQPLTGKKFQEKLIIPPVLIGGSLKNQGLMKTAMQTMLLEKVNIMGTYTPPTSPTIETERMAGRIDTHLRCKSCRSPPITKFKSKIPRSSTAASFSDYLRKNETVLGVPFTAINDIKEEYLKRQQSHPNLSVTKDNNKMETVLGQPFDTLNKLDSIRRGRQNCFSDSELHKPIIDSVLNKENTNVSHENLSKSKFRFLNLLSKARSHDSSLHTTDINTKYKRKFSLFFKNKLKKSSEEIHKKKFSFLHRQSNVSESDLEHHGSIISRIFYSKHSSGDIDNKPDKTETGATKGDLKPIEEKKVLEIPTENYPVSSDPSSLTYNIDNSVNNSPKNLPDVNIEIDLGSSIGINNEQACLTPRRNNLSPIPDQSAVTQGDRHSPEAPISKMSQSPAKLNTVPCIHRRSSDSDLSITPKGNSLTGSDRSGGTSGYFMRNNHILRSTVHQDNFDMLEYPFLTMSKFPVGFIVQLGGAVSARSVKLLERITNVEEPESRDTWWSELRMEIRSHARSLNCNAVLGYSETTSICDDICVLSATGTAAIIGFHYTEEMEDSIGGLPIIPKPHLTNKDIMTSSLDRNNFEKEKNNPRSDMMNVNKTLFESPEHNINQVAAPACTISHLPYDIINNVPINATITKCGLCSKGKVPDVLIATIEPPDGIPVTGRGCFIESFICRPLKDLKGESIAKDISDGLPFLEYELHRLLINKLKIKGMNAIFGLKIRISIGERMLLGIATGTAVFLASLPNPVLPKLVSDRTSDEKKLADLQKLFQETVRQNREIYQLKNVDDVPNGKVLSDNDDSEDEQTSIDLSAGNKDCCVLEVDDPQDAELVNLLMEERPPDGFHVVNTESVPGLEELEIVKNLQMFTQIYRAKILPTFSLNNHFQRLLRSVYFKLRRMVPCALCDLQFHVDLPEPDEIQLCVVGMALGLGKTQKNKPKPNLTSKKADDDLIFKLDEDHVSDKSISNFSNHTHLNAYSLKSKHRSPSKNRPQSIKQRHIPYKERHGVDITPLSYVPGGKIERYLGNLNFFFIRETTSIREEGGLSGFIHSFVTEVLAIVRAHITALGGNAMVAYFLTECVLNHNLHKNQGQCLINVGGDVVFVSYFKEDP